MDSLEFGDFSSFISFLMTLGPSSSAFCQLFKLLLVVQCCNVICEWPQIQNFSHFWFFFRRRRGGGQTLVWNFPHSFFLRVPLLNTSFFKKIIEIGFITASYIRQRWIWWRSLFIVLNYAGIFIKHRQGKCPIAETHFTPTRPIFIQESQDSSVMAVCCPVSPSHTTHMTPSQWQSSLS